jgi:hypothetical protein
VAWYSPGQREHGGGRGKGRSESKAAQVSWRKGVKVRNSLRACGALTFLPVPSICTHHFLDSLDFPPCTFGFGRMEERVLLYFAQNFTTHMFYLKAVLYMLNDAREDGCSSYIMPILFPLLLFMKRVIPYTP